MSNFTPLVTQEYEFEGDTITVTFARLKRKDMLAAMPALKKLNDAKAAEDDDAQAEAINDVLNAVINVVPDYVTEFNGLWASDGDAIKIKTVCEEFYFMKLAVKITLGIMNASAAQEGKS